MSAHVMSETIGVIPLPAASNTRFVEEPKVIVSKEP